MESGPMTRSRRNLLTESNEKENTVLSQDTILKNSSESNNFTPFEMEQNSVSSPARITRNRRSISLSSNPPDSPSRNLRKRTVSPESVKNSPIRMKVSKKMEETVEGSGMTPKKMINRIESSLSTVDSPKPRRTRPSLSIDSDSENNLRRSRRLSTELPVVKENPISEDIESLILTTVKPRRGKRLSVAPTQPVLIEECDIIDLNFGDIEEDSNDFLTTNIADDKNTTISTEKKILTQENNLNDTQSHLVSDAKRLKIVLNDINQNSPNNKSLLKNNKSVLNDSQKDVQEKTSDVSKDNNSGTPLKQTANNLVLETSESHVDGSNDTYLNLLFNDSANNLDSSTRKDCKNDKSIHESDREILGSANSLNPEKKTDDTEKTVLENISNKENSISSFEIVKSPGLNKINKSSKTADENKDVSNVESVQNSISLNTGNSNAENNIINDNNVADMAISDNMCLNVIDSSAENNIDDNRIADIPKDNNTSLNSKIKCQSDSNSSNISDKSIVDDTTENSVTSNTKVRVSSIDSNISISTDNSNPKSINMEFKNESISCIKFEFSNEKDPSIDKSSVIDIDKLSSDTNIASSDQIVMDAKSACVPLNPQKGLLIAEKNKSLNVSSLANKENITDAINISIKSKKRLSLSENNKSLNSTSSSVKSKVRNSHVDDESKSTTNGDVTVISTSKNDISSIENEKSLLSDKNENGNWKSELEICDKLPSSTPNLTHKSSSKKGKSSSSSGKKKIKLEESVTDSEDGSDDKSSIVDSCAVEAGSDYRSGDSMDESERREIEDHEIIDMGETIESDFDSNEEGSNDTYEKDSFLCSSESEDNILLSGTGDDLSSGEELTQSAKSKAKYNKRQEEKWKNASREMYLSRHSGRKSSINSGKSSDSDISLGNEKEITNLSMRNSSTNLTKDPLSISKELSQNKSALNDLCSSSDEDEADIRNTYNEELKKLQSIEVETESSSDESIKIESNNIENVGILKKSNSILNKSDSDIKLKKVNEKLNKSSILLEREKKNPVWSSLSKQESIERLKKLNESVTTIFTNFVKKIDSIDANIQNSHYKNLQLSNENSNSEVNTKRKNNLVNDLAENPQKKMCISLENHSLEKEFSSLPSVEAPTSEKSKQVPSYLKISNKSKMIKRRRNSASDSRINKIPNAASKLRIIPSDLIERKKENVAMATSKFKVENKCTWTSNAGNFFVTSTESKQYKSKSTTNFKVVSLLNRHNHAIKVDEKFSSGFVNFKRDMLENVKRDPSSNLRKCVQKRNARKKNWQHC